MTGIAWTDERVEHLKKLWASGLSATQCAAELSGPPYSTLPHISRNSAIGKVHRLGLSGRIRGNSAEPRKREVRPVQKTVRVTRPAGHNLKAASLVPGDDTPIGIEHEHDGAVHIPPAVNPCTLLDLNDEVCRWPFGDPQKADFHFCGGATSAPPYCPNHAAIAYSGPPVRRVSTMSSAERARRIKQGQLAAQARRAAS